MSRRAFRLIDNKKIPLRESASGMNITPPFEVLAYGETTLFVTYFIYIHEKYKTLLTFAQSIGVPDSVPATPPAKMKYRLNARELSFIAHLPLSPIRCESE